MKLYIPEIGDKIQLTADWSFNLYPENRNIALGSLYNHYLYRQKWVDNAVVPILRNPDYKVEYPDLDIFMAENKIRDEGCSNYDMYNKACRAAEQSCPEYVEYQSDYQKWCNECAKHCVDFISVTLKAGTVLTVDRIYIRKGNSEYSSVTFFAKNLGETQVFSNYVYLSNQKQRKVKDHRFWVKLADANNIEFTTV